MKKALALLLAAVMLVSMMPVAFAAAEKENNGTIETAQLLQMNDPTEGKLSDRNDMDIYRLEVPSSGKLSLSFNHPYIDDGSEMWVIRLLSSSGEEFFRFGSTGKMDKYTSRVISPGAGTCYVVVQDSRYYSDAAYTLTANFEAAADWESEPNDRLSQEQELTLNTYKYGTLYNHGDTDNYGFTLDKAGFVVLHFKHEDTDDGSDCWQITLYNDRYETVERWRSGSSDTHMETPRIGLTAGHYHVRVNRDNGDCVPPYGLAVAFTENARCESEPNDNLRMADPLPLNTWFNGTTHHASERDYYKITVPEDGMLRLGFANYSNGSNGVAYFVELMDAHGVYIHDDGWVGAYTNHTSAALGVSAGTYYATVTAFHVNEQRKPYQLCACFTPSSQWESENNDSFSTADRFQPGSVIYGTTAGSNDCYVLDTPADEDISLCFRHTADTHDDDWRVYLYDSQMHCLDEYVSRHDVALQRDATYYIRVVIGYGGGNNSETPYALTAAKNGQKAMPSPRLPDLPVLPDVPAAAEPRDAMPDSSLTEENEWKNAEQPKEIVLEDPDAENQILPFDKRMKGSLSDRNDVDTYIVSMPTDGIFRLAAFHDTDFSSSSCLWKIYISDMDDQKFQSMTINADRYKTELPGLSLAAGLYKVTVQHDYDYSPEPYYLEAECFCTPDCEKTSNHSLETAQEIELNTWHYGNDSWAYEQDYYTFTLTEPGFLVLNFEYDTPYGHDFYADLTNEAHEKIFDRLRFGDRNHKESPRVGLPAGTYTLKLYADDDHTFYRFCPAFTPCANWETERNNDFKTADPIAVNTWIGGSIHCDGDWDYYRFELPEPGYIRMSLDCMGPYSGGGTLYKLELLNGVEQSIYQNSTSTGQHRFDSTALGLDAGSYYVRLHEWNFEQDLPYQLNIQFVPAGNWEKEHNNEDQYATPIQLDTPITGTYSGEQDLYVLNVDRAQNVYIRATADGIVGFDGVSRHFDVKIRDSRGGMLNQNSSGQYSLNPGKYYISFDRGLWDGYNREPYTLCVGSSSRNPDYVTMENTVTADPLKEAVLPRTGTGYRYTIENTAGAEQVTGYAFPGQKVTVFAGPRPGYDFDKWTASGVSILNQELTSFTMPARNVTVKANWKTVAPPQPTKNEVIVEGSAAQNSGAGTYEEGATVVIHAGTKSGYTFDGWTVVSGNVILADAKADITSFTMPANAVKVRASWKKDAKPEYPEIDASEKFNDVPKDAWYVNEVSFVVSRGLFGGTGDYTFEPETPMTRAMLVTVLWRFEGQPKEGKNTFSDVPGGQWFTEPIAWAAYNGVVGGIGDNKFDPDGNVTREQMAAILFRYAVKKNFSTSKRAELNFPDGKDVLSYAVEPMQWAVAEKLIGGSDGKLLPQGNAIRAQVAAILMRFSKNVANR